MMPIIWNAIELALVIVTIVTSCMHPLLHGTDRQITTHDHTTIYASTDCSYCYYVFY
jgi:hypothetical protein